MDTKDLVTLLVALYAAALSTYVAVVQRRDKRPRVDAKVSFGFLTHGPNLSDPQLLLVAANVGERPVTLSSGGIKLPDRSQVISFGRNATENFPHQLDPGKSMTMWFEVKPLATQLRERGYQGSVKIRAAFNDQTSREHVSQPIDLDLTQWAP